MALSPPPARLDEEMCNLDVRGIWRVGHQGGREAGDGAAGVVHS